MNHEYDYGFMDGVRDAWFVILCLIMNVLIISAFVWLR